jgi:hypothetical protein
MVIIFDVDLLSCCMLFPSIFTMQKYEKSMDWPNENSYYLHIFSLFFCDLFLVFKHPCTGIPATATGTARALVMGSMCLCSCTLYIACIRVVSERMDLCCLEPPSIFVKMAFDFPFFA